MIAELIKEYVDEKGFKQGVIAENIGMSKVAMSETLNCNRKLGADEYVKICDFIEVPYDKFAYGAYEDGAEAEVAV